MRRVEVVDWQPQWGGSSPKPIGDPCMSLISGWVQAGGLPVGVGSAGASASEVQRGASGLRVRELQGRRCRVNQ
jgi:hypothetical protein